MTADAMDGKKAGMNKLFYGDNLEILRKHVADDSVDLVYIDPPFNSKRDYNIIYDGSTAQAKAFGDTWSLIGVFDLENLIFEKQAQRYHHLHQVLQGLREILYYSPNASDKSMYAYLVNMGVRIVEMHRTLKETGSFYLHCDPTASHYLKILLDAIFGKGNFLNEIVWCYRKWTNAAEHFQKNHDVIFLYAKHRSKHIFNKRYDEDTPQQKKFEKGWDVNVVQGGIRQLIVYDREKAAHKIEQGYDRIVYREGKQDVASPDWWEIPIINSQAKERLGYPTQKPEALLERIIQASCPKGGVVLDAYCGCGTTIAMAQRLGMKWIGIDITYLAIDLIQQRLIDHFYLEGVEHPTKEQAEKARKKFLRDTEVFGIPRDMESARKLARETKGDYVRKEFEKWAVFSVGGVYSEKKGSDGGVDGYFYIHDADKHKKLSKRQCYIQVKSGKVGVKDIRDFDSTLNAIDSPIGIFIAFGNEVTKPMQDYINALPKYTSMLGRVYSKITIITIEDILAEDVPDFAVRATRRAEAVSDEPVNGDLFLDADEA
ncbi:MAG: restriction endonuclease [Pseudomonadota bacterium]|nr:restriction endonuclease [Pseudomonadota bacterium]MDE3038275.1 restriction endonuclease [Pseudomonadota bacterium]